MKIPIIMDCDPGGDDSIAIIMALSNDKLDVKGITSVAGNVPLNNTTENAKKILKLMGSNVPLAVGEEKPLVCNLRTVEEIHGKDGLYELLENVDYKVDNRRAYEFIKDLLMESKEKITLVPTGPLTNIALLLKNYPEVIEKIDKICMMGGSLRNGNITEYAEFNAYTDPHAAEIVFNSGVPIIMCGLESSYKSICKKEDIDEIKKINNKKAQFVAQVLERAAVEEPKYIRVDILNDGDAPLYDQVTIAYLINPDIFKTEKYHIKVETEGERRGQTIVVDDSNKYNAEVVVDANRKEVINILMDCLK